MLKTKQISNCFLHECLASFLKQDGVNFGNDRLMSVVSRHIRFDWMAFVHCRLTFLGFDWFQRHSILNLT